MAPAAQQTISGIFHEFKSHKYKKWITTHLREKYSLELSRESAAREKKETYSRQVLPKRKHNPNRDAYKLAEGHALLRLITAANAREGSPTL